MSSVSEKMEKESNLIDLILERLGSELIKNPVFVSHKWPDDDAWACFWIAKKFMLAGSNPNLKFVFLNAGQTIPEELKNPEEEYIYFDTGGSESDYDHHNNENWETCSAVILAEKLHLLDDPETKAGLEPILTMVAKSDHAEPIEFTNAHFLIRGYPRAKKFQEKGKIDWDGVGERIFDDFEIFFAQAVNRWRNMKDFHEYQGVRKATFVNDLKVTSVGWKPELRDAAFEDGAAVVIWHVPKRQGKFYTGIAVNRKYKKNLFLDNVAASIRRTEAIARGMAIIRASSVGTEIYWYLFSEKDPISKKVLMPLILNGSKKYELSEEEFSKLSADQIFGIVTRVIGMISKQTVENWKNVK